MISTIDIRCNAAHPEMPLTPFVAFKTSPSSVRILDVPKKIGNWNISEVFVKVQYPDNSYSTKSCVRSGNVWVGTLDGTDTTGTVANGFMIGANGVDENGDEVSGYILGVGDVEILDADGSFHPDVQSHAVRILDVMPENPNVGDAYFDDGALMIMTNNGWSKTLFNVSQLRNDSNYFINGSGYLSITEEERGRTTINGSSIVLTEGIAQPYISLTGFGATINVQDGDDTVSILPNTIYINGSNVATYSYIDSRIKTIIGGYLIPRDTLTPFTTYAQLVLTTNKAIDEGQTYFTDGINIKNPNHNDLVVVQADETHDGKTSVYRWVGTFSKTSTMANWKFLYTVNGDKLSTAQKAVLDGGPYAKSGDLKNSTITITQGGVNKGSFTLNQGSDKTIELDAGGGGGDSKCLMHITEIGGSSQYVSWTSGNDTFKVTRADNGKLKLLKNDVSQIGGYGFDPIIVEVDGNVAIEDNGYSVETNVILDNVRQISYEQLNTTGKKTLNISMAECLEQSTPISMADGTTKAVCDLKIGDQILTLNPDTLQLEEDEVSDCDAGCIKMHNKMDVWHFADGTEIKTIKPHQFFNTRTGQMEYIADFQIGDGVRKQDGTTTTLTGHDTRLGMFFHNTLNTRKYNNYFANGILTGNRKSVKWGWYWKQNHA